MPNKHPRMRLSREEEVFLRHWMYDETHFREGTGPAKRLQLQHRAVPADLATLIAAALPEPSEQEDAGLGPPPGEPPTWPWSAEALRGRLVEARALLAERCGRLGKAAVRPSEVTDASAGQQSALGPNGNQKKN
jgi:hypothetical protein